MQKKRFTIIIFAMFLLLQSIGVFGSEKENDSMPEERIIEEQIDAGHIDDIGDSIKQYAGEDVIKLFPEFDPESILKGASTGNYSFSLKSVLESIVDFVFSEVYLNINLLIKLIILAVLCAVLKNLQTSFLSESVGEIAFYACYTVMVTILIISFNSAVNLGVTIIDNMVAFMQSTIPVLLSLLISGGNITSAAVFQPVLISVVGISATIVKTVFIPLIFLSTVLSIIDNISDKIQISKFAGLLRQISGWALGILMTIFIAIVSVQGSLGAVVDGVTGKTTKYAIGTLIPVAGKYLADAADTVVGCTLLIKNAGGLLAMIGIIMICLVPILKIFALIAVYKLACALIEPISENRITRCINDMAGSMSFILGIVASVAVMFLISLAVIICASNISTMVR